MFANQKDIKQTLVGKIGHAAEVDGDKKENLPVVGDGVSKDQVLEPKDNKNQIIAPEDDKNQIIAPKDDKNLSVTEENKADNEKVEGDDEEVFK